MTKKEIKRYFDDRPRAERLFVVDGVVFTNDKEAASYAKMFGSVVETFNRDETTEPAEEATIQVIAKKASKSKKDATN